MAPLAMRADEALTEIDVSRICIDSTKVGELRRLTATPNLGRSSVRARLAMRDDEPLAEIDVSRICIDFTKPSATIVRLRRSPNGWIPSARGQTSRFA